MLDVSVRAGVLKLLDGLRRSGNLSVLMITHDLSTAAHFADRIAVMYLGRIVEVGPTDSVVAEPRHPYTRALLAAVPTLREPVPILDPDLGEPPDPHQPPPGCHFHPRCPIGPAAFAERRVCIEQDPRDGADERPHHNFCHFSGAGAARPFADGSERAAPTRASRA